VDGEHIGTTPLTKPLFVSPGTHTLRVTHPQLAAVQKEIESHAGEILTVSVDMPHAQATVLKP
jgi:hypothetical protein